MLDSESKAQLGIQGNWEKFSAWKSNFQADYKQENGRCFKEAHPNPESRKAIYEYELKKLLNQE